MLIVKNKIAVIAVVLLLSTCFTLWNFSHNNIVTKSSTDKASLYAADIEHKILQSSNFQNSILADDSDFFSRIVYNRVGKCGSRSMQNVILNLSAKNRFQYYISPTSNQTRPPILSLKSEVKLISSINPPMLYSRHIYYINFEKFGVKPPIYINLIRDPIERFSSQYHFKRNGDLRNPGKARFGRAWKKGERELDINDCILQNFTECSAQKLWYIIPYFCGQELMCRFPSNEALQRAKRHLLDKYLVVGLLEDFENTLKVFEKLMPYHFKGASKVWADMSESTFGNTSTYKKRMIKPEAYSILKQRMALDYEFYYFAERIYKNVKAQLSIK